MQAVCLLALRIPVSLMKGELELSLSSLNEEIEMQCGALPGFQLPQRVFGESTIAWHWCSHKAVAGELSLETFMGLSHLVPGFWTDSLISHVMEDKVFKCWKRKHTDTGCRRHCAEHSCSRRWPAFGAQHALSTCLYFQLFLKALLECNLSL